MLPMSLSQFLASYHLRYVKCIVNLCRSLSRLQDILYPRKGGSIDQGQPIRKTGDSDSFGMARSEAC